MGYTWEVYKLCCLYVVFTLRLLYFFYVNHCVRLVWYRDSRYFILLQFYKMYKRERRKSSEMYTLMPNKAMTEAVQLFAEAQAGVTTCRNTNG